MDIEERRQQQRVWDYELSVQNDMNKFVLCTFEKSKDHTGYRAFLTGMTKEANALNKDGWWSTFSYTTTPTLNDLATKDTDVESNDDCIWLAQIIDVRKDKDDYTNFVIKPITRLGKKEEIVDSRAIAFLNMYHAFAPLYIGDSPNVSLNIETIKENVGFMPTIKLVDRIIEMIKEGSITFVDIERWLLISSPYELLTKLWESKDINERVEMERRYPHTAKRIPVCKYHRKKITLREYLDEGPLEDILAYWDMQACDMLGISRSQNALYQIVASRIETYWTAKDAEYAEKREQEKRARRAKRLAKKK